MHEDFESNCLHYFLMDRCQGGSIHHNYGAAMKLHAMSEYSVPFHNKQRAEQIPVEFFCGATSPLQQRDHVALD